MEPLGQDKNLGYGAMLGREKRPRGVLANIDRWWTGGLGVCGSAGRKIEEESRKEAEGRSPGQGREGGRAVGAGLSDVDEFCRWGIHMCGGSSD